MVHATLQWHSIGEKQSKFFMLGDIFSDPVHFNRSTTEIPEKCLCKRCLLPVFDIYSKSIVFRNKPLYKTAWILQEKKKLLHVRNQILKKANKKIPCPFLKTFESALHVITLASAWSDNCTAAPRSTRILAPDPGVRSTAAAPPAAVQGLPSPPPWKQEQLQQSHDARLGARWLLRGGARCCSEGLAARPAGDQPQLPARCFRTAPMSMWKPTLKSDVRNYKTGEVVSLAAGYLLICSLHSFVKELSADRGMNGYGIFNPHFPALKIQG